MILLFGSIKQSQIIDDSLNLARGNLLNYKKALNTIDYLRHETDYIPWLAAFENLNFILNRFTVEEKAVFEVNYL